MKNNSLIGDLKKYLDLPTDQAAQQARRLGGGARVAVVVRSSQSYCAINGEHSFVGFGDSASELVSSLVGEGWRVEAYDPSLIAHPMGA